MTGLERTYEELKPLEIKVQQKPVVGLERTYEELKQRLSVQIAERQKCLERTYEELKLNDPKSESSEASV